MKPTKHITILPQAEALAISMQAMQNDSCCVVVKDDNMAEQLAPQLKFFYPEAVVLSFPSWGTLPYDRVSPNPAISNERLTTLTHLQMAKPGTKFIIITPVAAILQKTIPQALLKASVLKLKAGDKLSHAQLQNFLVELGYVRLINAVNSGEFAVRGSIIDLVVANDNKGYRLDFFGEHLEHIKVFSTETQTSSHKVDELIITPTSEVLLNPHTTAKFKEQYIKRFGLTGDVLLESVMVGKRYSGLENWLPIFYDAPSTLFDYLPKSCGLIVYQGFDLQLEDAYQRIGEAFSMRLSQDKAKNNGNYHPLEPNELYLPLAQIKTEFTNFKVIGLSYFSDQMPTTFRRLENLRVEAQLQKISVFERLKNQVNLTPDQHTLIACYTKGSLERLKNHLSEYEIHYQIIDTFAERYKLESKVLGLCICPLDQGFGFENTNLYSERDIFGERLSKDPKVKKFSANILNELNAFTQGDIIVHIEHGIGKFMGLETLQVSNAKHDFVKILYADNDKLFLPVENLELITRYGGHQDIALDKLGGVAWQLRKAKLKNKIKIAAEALMNIAAQRALMQVNPVVPYADLYQAFCDKFPYVETEDQLKAIEEVTEDLLSGKPMDRLICGDVGFGKTEVALRAAFIAAANPIPQQVALLVPTTLLARQHDRTFRERFAGFPFKIKQLSKFSLSSEIKETKQGLAEGRVDIVIGTHALLAKNIQFKNLGLIIIDEEQHFGVGQKERLKELKANCHVLTLSATPIPRTLQMSLNGIKELSLITTPPPNRLPVITYVLPYDEITIREAILREFYRGGRVFFVTPRISYIDSILERLKEIAPEVSVVKAHGQLNAAELDSIMNDFYDGKYQVLVSTTIIESGLDIPMANTIIVDSADMFGLAQLYQIRGRVGRSNVQAYAYFIYHTNKKLNEVAEKRLNVIQSLNSLGAGFAVAAQDMDIRGHGNLVGEEQSGHVKEVGIELYQHMLEEAIANLKQHKEEVDDDFSPVLNIGLSVQIPEDYIIDVALRLSLYRRIAALNSPEEVETLAAEMIDRFGSLPIEAEHLLSIVKLKQLAKGCNIARIDQGEKGLLITFRNKAPKSPDAVIKLVEQYRGVIKIRPDEKLFITQVYRDEQEKIKQIEKILIALFQV